MDDKEQKAHDEVLRICRKTPPGAWVMREGVTNPIEGVPKQRPCNVWNLSPGGYRPYRKLVADGETWVEVLGKLKMEE